MKIELKRINRDKLITPANYGLKKGIDRKVVYYLIKADKIDFAEIDGVLFIFLNTKSRNYKKA
jgi:hypothetical protein